MRYKLNENSRVTQLRGKGAAPGIVKSQKKKNFSLSVICAVDYPRRIVLLENMQMDLLHRGLYKYMLPESIVEGKFTVVPGYEQQFREIAWEHGFNACEVIICG